MSLRLKSAMCAIPSSSGREALASAINEWRSERELKPASPTTCFLSRDRLTGSVYLSSSSGRAKSPLTFNTKD
jgi:hypothetical protein